MAALPKLTARILKNTQELVKLYNTNPKFKQLFDQYLSNPSVTYLGLPLKLYPRVITAVSQKYKFYDKQIRSDPGKNQELLEKYYKDASEFPKLQKAISDSSSDKFKLDLPPEEMALVENIDKTKKDIFKRQWAVKQYFTYTSKEEKAEEVKITEEGTKEVIQPKTILEQPRQTVRDFVTQKIRKLEVPFFVKDLTSKGQILARKVLVRYAPNFIGGVIGSVTLGGLSGSAGGFIAGAVGGGLFPNLVKSGAVKGIGEFLAKKGAMTGAKALIGAAGAPLSGGTTLLLTVLPVEKIPKAIFWTAKKIIIFCVSSVAAVILLLMAPGVDLLKSSAAFPPFDVAESAPLPPGPVPSGSPTPPINNNYQAWIMTNFNIQMENGFPERVYQLAYEVLNKTYTSAPNFRSLIHSICSIITIIPANIPFSTTSGCTIRLNQNVTAVAIALIHELGHIIFSGNSSYYSQQISSVRQTEGALTYYSEHATPPEETTLICGSQITNYPSEEFADSITYFINDDLSEVNYGVGCSVKWPNENPYQSGRRYPLHHQFMSNLLK
ncbi:MAG: hypothetical protein V1808_00215 [Candidatus Daviesbacteria bacterium]